MGWRLGREFTIAATMVLMLWVPYLGQAPWWFPWVMLVVIDFTHWLADIGLSSRVAAAAWGARNGLI